MTHTEALCVNRRDVQEFIVRRFGDGNPRWLDGNCYWFAQILCERFPGLVLYYCPIAGHFLAGDSDPNVAPTFYDYTGVVHPTEKPILFSQIQEEDPLLYNRIIRDCKN